MQCEWPENVNNLITKEKKIFFDLRFNLLINLVSIFFFFSQAANKMEQNDAVLNVRKSLHNAAGFSQQEVPQVQRKTLLHGQQNSRDSIDNTGFQNSNFKISEIEMRLAKLGQIQLMLEHLLLIQINLNVNSSRDSFFHFFGLIFN